jgi:plasmid stabilization system protein ParE
MKLRWSDRGRQDPREIGRDIARDTPDAAREWVSRLRPQAVKAAAIPRAGLRATPRRVHASCPISL